MGKGEPQKMSPERQTEGKLGRPLDGSLQVMESHGRFSAGQGRQVWERVLEARGGLLGWNEGGESR